MRMRLTGRASDVGSFVILTPAPQQWIQFLNQLLDGQRRPPLASLSYPVDETTDRFLLGVRIQCTLSDLTTDLAFWNPRMHVMESANLN